MYVPIVWSYLINDWKVVSVLNTFAGLFSVERMLFRIILEYSA